MGILQNLNEEHGLTVVIVTHEHDIAQYAKRAVELRDGRIRLDVKIQNRLIAAQVLPTLPSVDEDILDGIANGQTPASPGGNGSAR
jgi:putative ABC transport system ATP-binding protein